VKRVRRQAATRALSALVTALATAVLLTGCGNDGYEPAGPFRPLPEGAPPEVAPPSTSAPLPDAPADPGAGGEAGDPNVVASGLSVPTGLVVLPDLSAIVAERDTGRLLQVFADHSPARVLMTVPGIDTAGDGGLLGLTVSPTYLEDGLLYAYVSTATDNRVVRFPIGGTPKPVLTGIPRGETHNGGGLAFAADGTLLVGTGDAGNPALAADPQSLAGKVLRTDVFGRPIGASVVYSRGFQDVAALCLAGEQAIYATDDGGPGPDELDQLVEGADYATAPPLARVDAAEGGLGGCAAGGGAVFLGALDGERVHAVPLDETGAVSGDAEQFLQNRYGRLRSVALDAEGALWITTSNRDGIGTPEEDDDRVLRIQPPSTAGSSPL
jgi:glucose/arabinose dehydrogenase